MKKITSQKKKILTFDFDIERNGDNENDLYEKAQEIEDYRSNKLQKILNTNPYNFQIVFKIGYTEKQTKKVTKKGLPRPIYKYASTVAPLQLNKTQPNILKFVANVIREEADIMSGEMELGESEYALMNSESGGNINDDNGFLKSVTIRFIEKIEQKRL